MKNVYLIFLVKAAKFRKVHIILSSDEEDNATSVTNGDGPHHIEEVKLYLSLCMCT